MESNPLDKQLKSFKEKFDILVELFLVKQERNWGKSDFSREYMAAKRLLKKYPDFDFFYTLQEIYNKYNSFLGLQTKYWSGFIDNRWKSFIKEKGTKFDISGQVLIDIIDTKQTKARNLIEFLDGE
jgi:hypothetical protein